MTYLVVALVVLFTASLAWRGYRRGAAASLRGWAPRISAVAGVYAAAWIAWSVAGSIVVSVLSGLAAGITLFGLTLVLMRRTARPRDDGAVRDEAARERPSTIGRIAGAALGVLHAEICCIGLAAVGSTIVFGVSVSNLRPDDHRQPTQLPEWARYVGTACVTVADLSDVGLIRRIPLLKEYGREILPLIQILNAPRDKLELIAEKHDLMRFAEIPIVREALTDRTYGELIDRAKRGDITALRSLYASPMTKKLLACPEIRQFAEAMTPSQLAKGMEAGPQPAEPRTATSSGPGAEHGTHVSWQMIGAAISRTDE
jgi:hypothetical protein